MLKMIPKPSPPSRAEINAEVERNLKALGIDPSTVDHRPLADRVYDSSVRLCMELKRPANSAEIARDTGLGVSTVCKQLSNLHVAGRAILTGTHTRPIYIPIVVEK